MASRNRKIVVSVANGVSWSVLPLVAGLFVIVEALRNAGLLHAGITGLNMLAHTSALGSQERIGFCHRLAFQRYE